MSWIVFSCVLTACASALCAIWSFANASAAFRASESLRRRLESVESQTQLLNGKCAEWQNATEQLADSLKMMKVRRAMPTRAGADGEPDATREPEAWRAWQNARIRLQRNQ